MSAQADEGPRDRFPSGYHTGRSGAGSCQSANRAFHDPAASGAVPPSPILMSGSLVLAPGWNDELNSSTNQQGPAWQCAIILTVRNQPVRAGGLPAVGVSPGIAAGESGLLAHRSGGARPCILLFLKAVTARILCHFTGFE